MVAYPRYTGCGCDDMCWERDKISIKIILEARNAWFCEEHATPKWTGKWELRLNWWKSLEDLWLISAKTGTIQDLQLIGDLSKIKSVNVCTTALTQESLKKIWFRGTNPVQYLIVEDHRTRTWSWNWKSNGQPKTFVFTEYHSISGYLLGCNHVSEKTPLVTGENSVGTKSDKYSQVCEYEFICRCSSMISLG